MLLKCFPAFDGTDSLGSVCPHQKDSRAVCLHGVRMLSSVLLQMNEVPFQSTLASRTLDFTLFCHVTLELALQSLQVLTMIFGLTAGSVHYVHLNPLTR